MRRPSAPAGLGGASPAGCLWGAGLGAAIDAGLDAVIRGPHTICTADDVPVNHRTMRVAPQLGRGAAGVQVAVGF